VIVEPARRDEFLALMQETYGAAMSPAEFDWWFDGNPAGERILNEARDEDGTALGVLAMSCFRMSQGLAAFAVHAVTTPRARGRGVFSTLELHNEEQERLRRRGAGRLRVDANVARPEVTRPLPAHHIVRDPAYVNWRYVDSPRAYAQIERRLIFATQKLDSRDPILAATVAQVRALAARVD
jgi:hypothetical protein